MNYPRYTLLFLLIVVICITVDLAVDLRWQVLLFEVPGAVVLELITLGWWAPDSAVCPMCNGDAKAHPATDGCMATECPYCHGKGKVWPVRKWWDYFRGHEF